MRRNACHFPLHLSRGLVLLAIAYGLYGWEASASEPVAPSSAAKEVFFFIPHTHWEGAVFRSREEYLDMGLPNILRALRLLKDHPNYRFVLDQGMFM